MAFAPLPVDAEYVLLIGQVSNYEYGVAYELKEGLVSQVEIVFVIQRFAHLNFFVFF